MNSTPLISVIIATSNRPELAFRAVNSILMQSYEHKEIIVISNGSSIEAAEKYVNLFSALPINYIDLNNNYMTSLGPSAARNVGIEQAKGSYIAFCDDDDEWILKDYLSSVAKIIDTQSPDIIFADQEAVTIDHLIAKKSWFHSDFLEHYCNKITTDSFFVNLAYFYKYGGFPHLNASVYSKDLINKKGKFLKDVYYEEDFEFFIRLSSFAKKVIYLDRLVSRHYIPNKKLAQNASTMLNEIEKELFRLNLFNKLSTINNIHLMQFLKKQSRYVLTKISLTMFKDNNYRLANKYAQQALGYDFNVKLFFFIYLQSIRFYLSLYLTSANKN